MSGLYFPQGRFESYAWFINEVFFFSQANAKKKYKKIWLMFSLRCSEDGCSHNKNISIFDMNEVNIFVPSCIILPSFINRLIHDPLPGLILVGSRDNSLNFCEGPWTASHCENLQEVSQVTHMACVMDKTTASPLSLLIILSTIFVF